MLPDRDLAVLERNREAYWRRYLPAFALKLRWRAFTVRHCFHVLPGQSILEVSAGSGLWTEHLTAVMSGQNPITAATFDENFAAAAARRAMPHTTVARIDALEALPSEGFDYVVGTAILSPHRFAASLAALHRVLKPGGQLLLFEPNRRTPWVPRERPVPRLDLIREASDLGFVSPEISPCEMLHPAIPRIWTRTVQSLAFILEHAPVVREACGTRYVWLAKPGPQRPATHLAMDPQLFDSTSFVVPCRNEAMNIERLVTSLVSHYDRYVHEIIIVNDGSKDETAAVTRRLMAKEPRVKLVDRQPPHGVGHALRDGYQAATGRYILTMDADFVMVVPEFRDLFERVGQGAEGVLGSRFSHESVLLNYPFSKILCNRAFHALLNLTIVRNVRDISNNLKLYRADILKNLVIEEPGFAANAETGLKPILAGRRVEEVPISWINRTPDMGSTSFHLLEVAPGYVRVLLRAIWRVWRNRFSGFVMVAKARIIRT